jgi:hypothetical protein
VSDEISDSAADPYGKAKTLCDVSLRAARLRRAAWGSLGWGAFTLALGFFLRSHTIFDYIWLAIGFFLVLEGAWILRSVAADPRVLLVEALALAALGLLNTVGLYFEIKSGIRPIGGLQIIFAGVLQLISAYSTFRSYPAYSQIYEHLDRACLHDLEIKIGDMWKRKAEVEPELVDFKCENKKCKAKFLPDMAILLLQDGNQVILAEKPELGIANTRSVIMSKMFKVELQIEGEKLKIEMSKGNLEKWQAWLGPSQNLTETAS